MDRRIADPENFVWPADDPLLCVLIAFAWIHTFRWANKARDTYGLEVAADEDEPAERWKKDELVRRTNRPHDDGLNPNVPRCGE